MNPSHQASGHGFHKGTHSVNSKYHNTHTTSDKLHQPTNLKLIKTIFNSTKSCISSYLVVKYDGKGGVYLGGADSHHRVHNNRPDCRGKPEGLQKVAQFNVNDVAYFSIDVLSILDGHSDCGGSAFWNAKKKREFTQKCSWNSFGSKTPVVQTDISLYDIPIVLEKFEEREMNDFLGQWYLLGEKSVNKDMRGCLIVTIFRHDETFYMKNSKNMSKQVYQIKDHLINSFAKDEKLFKMDGNIYSYKVTIIKHSGKQEHILQIKNTKDVKDERIFGAQIYSKDVMETLLKNKYKDFGLIDTKCYTD